MHAYDASWAWQGYHLSGVYAEPGGVVISELVAVGPAESKSHLEPKHPRGSDGDNQNYRLDVPPEQHNP